MLSRKVRRKALANKKSPVTIDSIFISLKYVTLNLTKKTANYARRCTASLSESVDSTLYAGLSPTTADYSTLNGDTLTTHARGPLVSSLAAGGQSGLAGRVV